MTSPLDRLRGEQLAALLRLRETLIASNRFYAPRLARPFSTLSEFSALVPFTQKSELGEDQRANPPFGTNLTEPLKAYTRFCQTSGTTGTPLRWLDTPESWDWMVRCWRQVFAAAGVTAEDRVFLAFSFGPFLGFWTAFDAAKQIGCLTLPGGGMSSQARLRTILETGSTVLCATPTYAIRLGESAAEEGIEMANSPVRAILVAREAGGSVPATRALLESLWPGAKVYDHHGMTETGPASYPCPVHAARLHVMEPEFFAEVVDPATGATVGDGDAGELILTNLGRTASPVIRYRTGDLVRPAVRGLCECGTAAMALEGGILSRCDDMVVIRGVNLYPSAIEDVLRSVGGVAEYRVEIATVRSMVELTVEAEPTPDAGPGIGEALEAALRAAFGLRVPVRITAPGSLPRYEMKARRWIRKAADSVI